MIKLKLLLDLEHNWFKEQPVNWFVVENELIYPHQIQQRLDQVLDSGTLQFNSTNLSKHIKPFTLAKIVDDEGSETLWFATSENVMACRPQKFYRHNVALIELTKIFEKFLINSKTFTQPRGVTPRNYRFIFDQLTEEVLRKYNFRINFANVPRIDNVIHREHTFGSGTNLMDVLEQIGKTHNAIPTWSMSTGRFGVDWTFLDTPNEVIQVNEDKVILFNQEQDIDDFCSSFESEQKNVVGNDVITVTGLQPISEDVRVTHDNAFIRLPSPVNNLHSILLNRTASSINPQGGAIYIRMPSAGRLTEWSATNGNHWRNILTSSARHVLTQYAVPGATGQLTHTPWSETGGRLRDIGVLNNNFDFNAGFAIAERRLPNYRDPITGQISSMDFFVIWHTTASNTIIGQHGVTENITNLTNSVVSFEQYSLLSEVEKSGTAFWTQGSTDIQGFGHFFGRPWFEQNERSLIALINGVTGAISVAGSNGLNMLSTANSSTATAGGTGVMPLRQTLDDFVSSLTFEPIPNLPPYRWQNWLFVTSHTAAQSFINSIFTIEYEPIANTFIKKTKEEMEQIDFTKSYSNRTMLTDAQKVITDMELTLKRTGNPLITMEYNGDFGKVGDRVRAYEEEYLIKAKTLKYLPDRKKSILELTKEFDLSKLIGVPSQHRELYIPDTELVPRYIEHVFDVNQAEFNRLKDDYHQFIFYAHGRQHYMVLNFTKIINNNTIIYTYEMADNFNVIISGTPIDNDERNRVDNTYVDSNGEVDYVNGTNFEIQYAISHNPNIRNILHQQQPLLNSDFRYRDRANHVFNTRFTFSGSNGHVPNRRMSGQTFQGMTSGLATDLPSARIRKDSREKLIYVFQFNLKT